MKNRLSLRSYTSALIGINTVVVILTIIGYLIKKDFQIIITGIILMAMMNLVILSNIYLARKDYKKNSRILKDILSYESYVEVIPTDENEDAHFLDFLKDICTFHAILLDEDEVQIIVKFQIEEKFETKSYKILSYDEFMEQFTVID